MMRAAKDYINLLPREEKKKAAAGLGKGSIVAMVFVLAWLGAFGWQVNLAWGLKKQRTYLDQQKQALLTQVSALQQELGISAAHLAGVDNAAVLQNILGERVLWSEVFKQFSRIVPRGLWFDTLEGSAGARAEVKIKGGAFSYLSVAEFMLSMEKSGYFESPQLLYAQKGVVQGQDVVAFEILSGIRKR